MILLIQYMLIFASVLMLVALGGCFSEHSGVINIGLEGIMVFGALGGALMMKWLPVGASALAVISLSILAAVIFGMLYSLLLAVAAINFSADQTLVGTAMNLMGTALATVIVKAMNTAANPDNVSSTIQYINAKKAFLVNIGSFEFNWFMLLALILFSIAAMVVRELNSRHEDTTAVSVPADAVVVYYFHGTQRCMTCNRIEELTKQAVQENFADQLADGKIVFRSVNVDDPAKEHYIRDFQLSTRTVVMQKGDRYEKFDQIWNLVREPEQFMQYIGNGLERMLK